VSSIADSPMIAPATATANGIGEAHQAGERVMMGDEGGEDVGLSSRFLQNPAFHSSIGTLVLFWG
jgi:hypothetical protein